MVMTMMMMMIQMTCKLITARRYDSTNMLWPCVCPSVCLSVYHKMEFCQNS